MTSTTHSYRTAADLPNDSNIRGDIVLPDPTEGREDLVRGGHDFHYITETVCRGHGPSTGRDGQLHDPLEHRPEQPPRQVALGHSGSRARAGIGTTVTRCANA